MHGSASGGGEVTVGKGWEAWRRLTHPAGARVPLCADRQRADTDEEHAGERERSDEQDAPVRDASEEPLWEKVRPRKGHATLE